MTQNAGGKGNEIMRALLDLVVVVLLLIASGFGGYWYGLSQRLAPVQNVPPGTPGALPAPIAALVAAVNPQGTATNASQSSTATTTTASTSKPVTKKKYWVTSSGTEYIGSAITVKVNDATIDMFYGPGKLVNVTDKIRSGQNTVTFETKVLGSEYNKHKGDSDAVLTVQLVNGPQVQDNFKPSDVVVTYKRSATDSESSTESMHFTGD
jgi:hypothetical protein